MFPHDLQKQSDDALTLNAAARGSGETPELIRRLKDSVEKLNSTSTRQIASIESLNVASLKQIAAIENLNATSTKQQEEIIHLTRWIFRLTWVMAVVGVVQVAQVLVSVFK